MKIKITTYIDSEKVLEETHMGKLEERVSDYIIEYSNNQEENFKIVIDKIIERVSIEKDQIVTEISRARKKTRYTTIYGLINLETQLVNFKKQERNNFISFEIEYNIFFNKEDIQLNRLKILIKK